MTDTVTAESIIFITWAFYTTRLNYCILDDKKIEVRRGEPGELYVSGVQITKEYFNDPQRTRATYVTIPQLGNEVWFKTGDLVKERENGNLNYLGRLDTQVQILGNRVELQEVDCALKNASASELVVSLAWPVKNGIAEKIVAFIAEGNEQDKAKILDYCKETLPPYMIPREIFFIDKIPLNDNGKFDKQQLIQMLESNICSGPSTSSPRLARGLRGLSLSNGRRAKAEKINPIAQESKKVRRSDDRKRQGRDYRIRKSECGSGKEKMTNR